LLDKDLIVRYIGAIDDNSNAPEEVEERYVADAIAALEAGKSPDPATTKAIGCPISKSGEGGSRRGPKGPPSPEKIIEMMDTDNDQQVSRSEVQGPLARDFDRLDVNNDGMLSKEELSKLSRSN
jgi:hypothetical protein